jgi:putative ABC transport system substrate-binding protein
MQRRDFITLLGGAAAAWPYAACAQRPPTPVIGFLDLGPPRPYVGYVSEFRRGLAEAGYVEGRNLTIEYRWADHEEDRLPELAADLVRRQVAVIVALDSNPTVFAAKAATSTIPIVFAFGGDPVKYGLVASLNRPGGNLTGVTNLNTELGSKRLDLLHAMVPQAMTLAYLTDPRVPSAAEQTNEMQAAARVLGRDIIVVEARSQPEIEAAFETIAQRGAGALAVGSFLLFSIFGEEILTLAARHKTPTIYYTRGFARRGGLMSYGAEPLGPYRQIAVQYVARILKGAKPADLPVMQPTKFEFVINLQTARALGIDVPPTLLALADEVIE